MSEKLAGNINNWRKKPEISRREMNAAEVNEKNGYGYMTHAPSPSR